MACLQLTLDNLCIFRPLNDTEIAQFSFSRDENVTAVLKPDLLDWSNQFSYQIGKNVSISYIQRRDLHIPGKKLCRLT